MFENIKPIKTAGEIHNYLREKPDEIASPLDMGHAFCDKVYKGIIECIDRHYDTFSVTKFCAVCTLSHGEGGLKYLIRSKYYATPWLPTPFPNQSVWLFDKEDGSTLFLWSLPGPMKMAMLSEEFSYNILHNEKRTKIWCDAFFKGAPSFWKTIREMHGIDMLSEMEIENRNRKMGAKRIDDDALGLDADSFYLPEIRIKKLETVDYAARNQPGNNRLREAN